MRSQVYEHSSHRLDRLSSPASPFPMHPPVEKRSIKPRPNPYHSGLAWHASRFRPARLFDNKSPLPRLKSGGGKFTYDLIFI